MKHTDKHIKYSSKSKEELEQLIREKEKKLEELTRKKEALSLRADELKALLAWFESDDCKDKDEL